ncbi:helicase-like transcription factor [Rhinophrynus dorsalis]
MSTSADRKEEQRSYWAYLKNTHSRRNTDFSKIPSPYSFFNVERHILISAGDSSASEDEDTNSAVLFGYLRGNIVGLRYYTGVVNNNEMVALQREPNNQYDRNAIRVNNVNGDHVGHIKKELAAALAFIMDRNLAKIEGVVPYGAQNVYTMPVNLSFWGKAENKQPVLQHMTRSGFNLGNFPTCSYFSPGFNRKTEKAGTSSSGPLLPAVQMTIQQLKTEFDKLFEDLKEDDKTRELEPSESLETPLFPHQKQALAWMISRENSKELPPFWEKRNNIYYNTLTNFAEKEKPETVRGGILADDMGLGKTLITIALIVTNLHDGVALTSKEKKQETDDTKSSVKSEYSTHNQSKSRSDKAPSKKRRMGPSISHKGKSPIPLKTESHRPKRQQARKAKYTYSSSDSEQDEDWPQRNVQRNMVSHHILNDGREEPQRATLIICPLSVLSNWTEQLKQHLKSETKLKIYTYHGPERFKDSEFLSKQDVVLTTYNILFCDYGRKSESPLHNVKWLRVVLDEGHIIRNPNAQHTKAALSLEAERRWILTGTPIQNSLNDLWPLLCFLKLKPFTEREWWHRTIQRPVTSGEQNGLGRLQALIKNIALRRTKTSKVNGKPVVELPARKVFVQYIKLSEEERQIYECMKKEGQVVINRYFNDGNEHSHSVDVLAVLIRLRQLCCHPHLVFNSSSSIVPSADCTPEELRETLVNKMKLVLSSGSHEDCAICLDSLKMPVITHCAHIYCKPCICLVIEKEKPYAKCPLCRGDIRKEQLVECPPEEPDFSEIQDHDKKWMSSSKINALMQTLIDQRSKDSNIKSIIVSQFTAFLSLIGAALRDCGFIFTRLDGTMTPQKRTEAIESFQRNNAESPAIMLLSLKVGGVGLNLPAASRMFLMEPAWNPAVEEQCFDRCHRLGQTKEVIITKYVVKDSIEEKMLNIQAKKRELAAGAFGTKKQSVSEAKQGRMFDLKSLVDL